MPLSNRQLLINGLWTNNPGLVQLLGLCPLLAVTTNAVSGLGLGLATLVTMLGANITVSLLRRHISTEIRIPVFVLIIATFVTTVEFLMSAFFYGLYQVLGLFIPLIVTNCSIIGRAEAFAVRHGPWPAALDALAMGTGFALVLIALGAFRELLAQGTVLSGAAQLLGTWATVVEIHAVPMSSGLLLAALPPGAFMGLGVLIAAKNAFALRPRKQPGATCAGIRDHAAPQP